jgi:hypothetical protein
MGVDLYCGDLTFSCSYSCWNNIREGLIIATFKYINNFCELNKPDDTNMCRTFHHHLMDLNDANNLESFSLMSFINNCSNCYVNALIFAGLGGIFSLANKSDCEGLYSVGNSYDICELLKLVKPYLYGVLDSKTDADPQDWLFHLVEAELVPFFQHSVDNRETVLIC